MKTPVDESAVPATSGRREPPASAARDPELLGATPVLPEPLAGEPGGALADLDPQSLRAVANAASELAHTLEGFGLPTVVGSREDPDAPELPLSEDEPPPVPAVDPAQLAPDAKLLAGLQRLAGQAGQPEQCRRALTSALAGERYDPRHLPDSRALLLGIARILVKSGVPADVLVEAVIDAMYE